MGVDLTLLAEPYDMDHGALWPSIQLPLERRRDLWDRIDTELEIHLLGQEMYWHYEEEELKRIHVDPYGSELKFVTAESIAKLLAHFNNHEAGKRGSAPWANVAAANYLKMMQPHHRIILWWH